MDLKKNKTTLNNESQIANYFKFEFLVKKMK